MGRAGASPSLTRALFGGRVSLSAPPAPEPAEERGALLLTRCTRRRQMSFR